MSLKLLKMAKYTVDCLTLTQIRFEKKKIRFTILAHSASSHSQYTCLFEMTINRSRVFRAERRN